MSAKTVSIPEQKCPYCGYVLNTADMFIDEARPPNERDVNCCINCGGLTMYDAQLRFRKPSVAELAEIKAEGYWPKIEELRTRIACLRKKIQP